ncbi:MAG TPA: tetratricopeptide repeat protein [Thermodesulfovibrionales bacterium]|nr:tetratricopeptide repeat protein [Thermodesulfovibrionales bacterium]
MKRTVAALLLAFVIFACKQKEESKLQPPLPGGPIQSLPGKTLEEEKLLRDVLAKDPKNLNAWIQLGNMMMDTARFNEAVDAYTKALELDPKNVDVRVDMGTCLRNSGKPDLAIKEFKKATEINPNHIYAHINMGIVLANDKKDYKAAVSELEKGLSLNPNVPNAQAIREEIQRLKTMK